MHLRMTPLILLSLLAFTSELTAYFPSQNENWESLTPTESGADPALLQSAIDYAGSNNTDALVVLYQGKIVVEQYWNQWNRSTKGPSYSIAKSVVSALVGQAIAREEIQSLNQPSVDFLSEWENVPTYEDIQILHHLTMTTGFDESPLTLFLLQQASNERRFGTRRDLEHSPGTSWYYNDAAYRLLFYLLEEASETSLPELSQAHLFEPIGMNDTEWAIREETVLGQTIENYQWLNFTALDAARFGLLALNQGNWNGTQIVPTNWIAESTVPQHDFAPWYGRLWWLNSSSRHRTPSSEVEREGPFAPDAPSDMFAALGAFDQKIYIIPSMDLVVVRLGDSALESSLAVGIFDNLLLGQICQSFGHEGRTQELQLELNHSGNELQLNFPTWNGRRYTLSRAPNLESTWEELEDFSNLLGDGRPVQLTTPIGERQFFRLQTSFEPTP